jgi:hypothetical protein
MIDHRRAGPGCAPRGPPTSGRRGVLTPAREASGRIVAWTRNRRMAAKTPPTGASAAVRPIGPTARAVVPTRKTRVAVPRRVEAVPAIGPVAAQHGVTGTAATATVARVVAGIGLHGTVARVAGATAVGRAAPARIARPAQDDRVPRASAADPARATGHRAEPDPVNGTATGRIERVATGLAGKAAAKDPRIARGSTGADPIELATAGPVATAAAATTGARGTGPEVSVVPVALAVTGARVMASGETTGTAPVTGRGLGIGRGVVIVRRLGIGRGAVIVRRMGTGRARGIVRRMATGRGPATVRRTASGRAPATVTPDGAIPAARRAGSTTAIGDRTGRGPADPVTALTVPPEKASGTGTVTATAVPRIAVIVPASATGATGGIGKSAGAATVTTPAAGRRTGPVSESGNATEVGASGSGCRRTNRFRQRSSIATRHARHARRTGPSCRPISTRAASTVK